MTELVALRPKTYAYLLCVIKQKLMLENYTDCLFNNKTIYRSQDRFKSSYHNMYTEEENKNVLSSNDDERLQTFDRITT